ncbi:hypothetical protein LCGC14_2159310 [marine sediment metagenome]|uniref:Uncharacterized protein n=1 Tax=marine sediment metagenome TaxID=412755 RepID=A0A0F9DTF2_9ZZZZ
MITKYAIKTTFGYVVRRGTTPGELAYYYAAVSDAKHFDTAKDATQWLERAAFHNGREGRPYSGSPQIVRVDEKVSQLTYVDAGPVA